MKKSRKARVGMSLVLLLFIVLFPGGCGIRVMDITGTSGKETVKKQKVVLLTKSTTSAFWKSVYAGANAASTEYNLELIHEGPDSEEDYETQNSMIQQAIVEKADAIVFSAVDYQSNASAINEAAKKGIKIVVIDSDVNSQHVSCRIGTDNYEAGCRAANAAMQSQEEILNVGIVNFDKITENGQSREKGFRDTIEQDPRTHIIDSINVLSTTEDARTKTNQMLRSHPEINVIVTFNEWTSLGVGYAVKESDRGKTTMVVAFDSNPVSVGMLESGEVDALIVQNPYAIGYMGVESAYRLLNNLPLSYTTMDMPVHVITRENMYEDESQRSLFAFE